jgi:hypothetical protein
MIAKSGVDIVLHSISSRRSRKMPESVEVRGEGKLG